MKNNILVVGGAGYIGSHMVKCLVEAGANPIVLDNLVCGYRQAIGNTEFIEADIGDGEFLRQLFTSRKFDGVMHFASYIQVGESVSNPAKYYDNNLSRTITLLNAMIEAEVNNFIFSSTAAIFGNPQYTPINENHPTTPINPYGRSKLMVEQLLQDYASAYSLRFGALRYFNAAGAHSDGTIGEMHEPETHLIPLVLQVASGRRKQINLYGDNYATADGTCIRDYVHVCDIADAHLLMLHKLQNGLGNGFFNLGTGVGYSVKQVIERSEAVTGQQIKVNIEARRVGDPAILIADGTKARQILGWNPTQSELDTIIKHAWNWEQTLAAKQL